jgi:hypothetical protein
VWLEKWRHPSVKVGEKSLTGGIPCADAVCMCVCNVCTCVCDVCVRVCWWGLSYDILRLGYGTCGKDSFLRANLQLLPILVPVAVFSVVVATILTFWAWARRRVSGTAGCVQGRTSLAVGAVLCRFWGRDLQGSAVT